MTPVSQSLPMTERADGVPGPTQGCWTYEDYAKIPEDGNRYEIADGVLYLMAGPTYEHQSAVGWLYYYLMQFVQIGGLGRVLVAPFDVELPTGDTFQPDVIVVLNAHLNIITPACIKGVPDLVVEVASPGTISYDRRTKWNAYARAGVPEYWLADPYSRSLEVRVLDGGEYRQLGVFEGEQPAVSRVLPGFSVQVQQFFA